MPDKYIRDAIIGILGVIVGFIIYFWVIPNTIVPLIGMGHRLQGGSIVQLPDYMPKVWTAVLLVSSIVLLIENLQGLKKNITEEESLPKYFNKFINNLKKTIITNRTTGLYVGALLVVMILYIILLPIIGYIFSTALCLTLSLWLYGFRNIIRVVIFNIVFIFSVYFALTRLFYVSL